jgi:SAM-dependent methyltransferase
MNTDQTSNEIIRSFIIPVLDYSPHSPYNIETLLKDLENIPGEVICVFNSIDVFDKLHNHPRINKYCFNNLNAGVSRSWNIGINMAEGRSAFILNADIHILPLAVEQMESHLYSLDKAVIVGPQGAHIDYKNHRDIRYFQKGTFNEPVQVHAVSGFLFAIHIERYHKHNLGFDVQFSPCFYEEWDIGLQLMQAGLACYAVPVMDFDHHWGVSQDKDLTVNYFGREMTREDIFPKNKKYFTEKWHNVISDVAALNKVDSNEKSDNVRAQKFDNFLEKIKKETYPEEPSSLHTTLTKQVIGLISKNNLLQKNSKVLDVGCGQGVALELFKREGFSTVGITLNSVDVSVCKQKGYEVYEMDQSFLDFEDEEFDFIWCRHCLEHSIFPYFTLSGFFRVLKPGGYLYVEVPALDTVCNHQTNKNHYSILGKSMWVELIERTGFKIVNFVDIPVELQIGTDHYLSFIQQKPSP